MGRPLAYTVQALGVSREELLRVTTSLTAMPSGGTAGALPQTGAGGVASRTTPSVLLFLLLAGSLLLTGWRGHPRRSWRGERE